MIQSMKVVMTRDPVTVEPRSSVTEVASMMKQLDVGAVVVEEGGRIWGLVPDRDIVVRAIAEGKDAGTTPVADLYSGDVHTVAPDEPLERAVEQMRSHAVRRLPVVEGDRAVGILSIGDLAIERDERSAALADISAAPPGG